MRARAETVSAERAVAEIKNSATIAVGGFVGAAHPELLTATLEKYFQEYGRPRDLTLLYAAGQGDGESRGLNHLAHSGLVKRVIGGHWNLAPKLGKLALENKIEAYNFPQGVISVLFREIAAGRPGLFTKVGMGTFIDPENDGGKLNERTTEDLVKRVELDGDEWLFYKSIPIDVALIRGTCADRNGNIAMDHEGIIGEVLPIAQAAKNSGGIVIAQVEEVVDCIADPKAVRVPGILVDFIVESTPESHAQTFGEQFNVAFTRHVQNKSTLTTLPFSERKIIGRRALQEIEPGSIVNLGIGLPEAVAAVAAEENRLDDFTLTVESGPIGGVPASGLSFGCSHNPEAIIDQPSQFDFYDGGGLDIAVLGAAEIDRDGNVNVTKFGGRFAGIGGFANISRSAKRLVFCSTFCAGGLQIACENGELKIISEGRHRKFVERVSQVSFHAPSARERGQEVLYVTERAVFRLADSGLELIEVAPGVDLQQSVLSQMEFSSDFGSLAIMSEKCFQ